MRNFLRRISFGHRGRVPKRNRPSLRLEELETRTVLSPAGLPAALFGVGMSSSVFSVHSAAASVQATFPGQADPRGVARGLVSRLSDPGSTSVTTSTPMTISTPMTTSTVSGSNLFSSPISQLASSSSADPSSSLTSTSSQGSSQTSATMMMATSAAQQIAVAVSPALVSASQVTQPTATITNTTITQNNAAQQSSAPPQSLLVVVLNEPLLVAGATQRAETTPIITAVESNPDGVAVSSQAQASLRASTRHLLRVLLGDVRLSDIDDGVRKDDGRNLDKPLVPGKTLNPSKQEKFDSIPAQPDKQDVPPTVPLEEDALLEGMVSAEARAAYFAIWEAGMAPATDHETSPQLPVPASGEESPNWSVAALGLVLGGLGSMNLARPREERNRHPAWRRPQ